MNLICPGYQCSGCSACYSACPAGCISMAPDDEGFLHPVIDESRCTDCEACIAVCQARCSAILRKARQRYYAAKNSDEVRVRSSSGGVFTAISDHVLKMGGAIAGAVQNSDYSVSHVIAEDAEERDAMRATFYIQSDLGNVFSEVRQRLAEGQPLLFVGTPCQVKGLNLYLGTDHEKLTTCDLICHGVASPAVFRSFVEFVQEKKKDRLRRFSFRDPGLGWRGYCVSAEFERAGRISNSSWLKSFNFLFSRSYINRPSCSRCGYFSYDRCSDITIGDCWGIERHHPEFEDDLGVSLVITNTEKGERLFDSVRQSLEHIELKKEETWQNSLGIQPEPNRHRGAFWALYGRRSYRRAIRRYGEYNLKGALKALLSKNVVRSLCGNLSRRASR